MTSPVQDAVSTAVLVHLALRRETRRQLAGVLGVDPSAISNRLKGVTKWSLDDLDALARHWDISPAQLLAPPVEAFAGGGADAGFVTWRQRTDEAPVGSVLLLPRTSHRWLEAAA